jgi:hypothetical protein
MHELVLGYLETLCMLFVYYNLTTVDSAQYNGDWHTVGYTGIPYNGIILWPGHVT